MSLEQAKGVWDLSIAEVERARTASDRSKLKHGMFAGIPIICKADKCPYKSVCTLPIAHRELNKRCPIEVGTIVARFDSWCAHFSINCELDYIKDEDLVDATLVRDLVDLEVQMLRAENRIAINADFIAEVIATIDNKGKAYYADAVTPEAEFKLLLMDKRYRVLQLLDSTRKDKSKQLLNKATGEAIAVFRKVKDKMDGIDLSTIEITEGDK